MACAICSGEASIRSGMTYFGGRPQGLCFFGELYPILAEALLCTKVGVESKVSPASAISSADSVQMENDDAGYDANQEYGPPRWRGYVKHKASAFDPRRRPLTGIVSV